MRDISMAINTHQLGFLDVKFMSNFHMMGFFHLLLSHIPVTKKAIVIYSFIGEKITGEQLTGPRMTIHTRDTGRMDHRR
jgi:hypothetical protein